MGWYVDFYNPDAKVVIEVDGAHHAERMLEDNRRDEVMRANRFTVLRVPAWRVFNDEAAVVREIAALVDTPEACARRDARRDAKARRMAELGPPRRRKKARAVRA
jgi:very-short-patch-repair endonuclease